MRVIIICMNDNNEVISNNYGRIQDLVLLFKILLSTQNDFFEIIGNLCTWPKKDGSPCLFNDFCYDRK